MCILQSLWNTSSTQTTILFNARENLHREDPWQKEPLTDFLLMQKA